MNEPSVLTRMRLSCCWGDNLNEKELNEVVDYINYLERENQQLKERIDYLERSCVRKDDTIHTHYEEIVDLSTELDKYKSIIDEIKQTLSNEIKDGRDEESLWLMGCYDEAREILDKIKELEEKERY